MTAKSGQFSNPGVHHYDSILTDLDDYFVKVPIKGFETEVNSLPRHLPLPIKSLGTRRPFNRISNFGTGTRHIVTSRSNKTTAGKLAHEPQNEANLTPCSTIASPTS